MGTHDVEEDPAQDRCEHLRCGAQDITHQLQMGALSKWMQSRQRLSMPGAKPAAEKLSKLRKASLGKS